jgi:hypothetical protein
MTPEQMTSSSAVAALDLPPPKRWRRFLPLWLRSLIWVDSAQKYDAFLSYSWKADIVVAPVIQSTIQRFFVSLVQDASENRIPRPLVSAGWFQSRSRTL